MSLSSTYALDSSVFIEAKRRYYAFDLCPGFWEALLWHQAHGRVCSVDRVKAEIERGHDDLWEWISVMMPEACFAAVDTIDVGNAYVGVMTWVQGQAQFQPEAKDRFAASADGWLVAYAKATGAVVVTQERPRPGVQNRVPIPNVCEASGVSFVDTFDMLRALATRFIWQPTV